jgi:hypothetical protein
MNTVVDLALRGLKQEVLKRMPNDRFVLPDTIMEELGIVVKNEFKPGIRGYLMGAIMILLEAEELVEVKRVMKRKHYRKIDK